MNSRITTALALIVSASIILGFSLKKKNRLNDFVLIPMGTTLINGNEVSLNQFRISAYEVTNKQYNAFLEDLKKQGKTELLKKCTISNKNWQTELNDNYVMLEKHYHQHKEYENHPVLNISHEAAQSYCQWLTEKSERNFKYRLPTKNEWIYAAKGSLELAPYSWGGPYLRNSKGCVLCNYKTIGDEFIQTNSDDKLEIVTNLSPLNYSNGSLTTQTVNSYSPNKYGLYNVCGNAAEMIDEPGIAMGGSWNSTGYDVRVISESVYENANPFVGFRVVQVEEYSTTMKGAY